MMRRVFRLLSLLALCALLAFAPEILSYINGPYDAAAGQRVLLRVVLATDDDAAARAFYARLDLVRKQRPTWHFRVQRIPAQSLASLPDPLPDVYVFPASLSFADMALSPEGLLIPQPDAPTMPKAAVPASAQSAEDDSGKTGTYIIEETPDETDRNTAQTDPAGMHSGVRYALPIPAEKGETLLAAACARSPRVREAALLLAALTAAP